ncbi:alpha-1,6-mannosylglycoprotein 6-beta-N-acetylglucosaminyltransferase A-like isoform X2 [Lytechinus variegatus]|uniref:alpha-1,6-mannosylglycoprotein 6-beta-N-acetylglucosaminyltransferase A-like isoform X2 n=1 Tax=Lytechinus variegatus TaxID=7654 RepID=UPI001BB2986C|nr:alpha-1,6-mannosylglycoprotein 6-beta-N-acetylglucosaminyltransferase A-like isoform X2 [Lytechinus variegatus]
MGNQGRTRRSWYKVPPILSKRFGIIAFLTMILWTYTLFTFALYRTEPNVPESVKLKQQILELSKQYVKALADEQQEGKNLPEAYSSYDLKKTMAVLLDSILERLGKLEKRVDSAISNGTQNLLRNSSGVHQDVDKDRNGVESKEAVIKAKELIGEGADCSLTEAELNGFSSCKAKIAWMRDMWRSDTCYAQYGVDGTECSFRVYLSEVENWCPRVKGREIDPPSIILRDYEKAKIRLEKQGLFNLMQEPTKFRWIKMRISRMWDSMWVPAAEEFSKLQGDKIRERKKILVHIGALTKESGFKIADNAFNGGPLGELVQWSDILSTLYILGHDIEISTATGTLGNLLRRKGLTSKASCPVKGKNQYDLVYIDIVGMKQLKKTIGAQWQQFSCILRVIDSFGTEPAYNVDTYIKKAGTKSSWGNWNLVPRQFFTMFPHTPDNSFMGFVVDHQIDVAKTESSSQRTNRALVYGKSASFWTEPWIRKYLDKIHKKFEIHGTVFLNQSTSTMKSVIPDYVVNHGIVSGSEIQNLLKETKLFIGLGFPYEGPAPLEAVANGCVFLNPKFTPPKNSKNTKFFTGKPTARALTSQHPYTEVYIGQPHVWTVDVLGDELDVALEKIAAMKNTTSYLPFEFTCHGMLERVSSYIQKQEFCTGEKQWPPLSSLQVKVSEKGQSCRERCMEDDLVCEPGFFKQLNNKESIENVTSSKCSGSSAVEEIYAPSIESTILATRCYTQAHHLLYSCAGGGSNHKRLCPCRDYIKGQVALCRECRES